MNYVAIATNVEAWKFGYHTIPPFVPLRRTAKPSDPTDVLTELWDNEQQRWFAITKDDYIVAVGHGFRRFKPELFENIYEPAGTKNAGT